VVREVQETSMAVGLIEVLVREGIWIGTVGAVTEREVE
jgi:hypothetical protein